MKTVSDLEERIEELLSQIAILLEQSQTGPRSYFDSLEKENSQIEKYLSEFTQREGTMLTIAGLFALLPFTSTVDTTAHFLTWVMPFLLLAITAYICAAKRINIIQSENYAPLSVIDINTLLKRRYFNALNFHSLTDFFLITFFVSFVLNFYTYLFYALPRLELSILFVVVALFIAFIRHHLFTKVQQINNNGVIGMGGGIGTGGPSAEDFGSSSGDQDFGLEK